MKHPASVPSMARYAADRLLNGGRREPTSLLPPKAFAIDRLKFPEVTLFPVAPNSRAVKVTPFTVVVLTAGIPLTAGSPMLRAPTSEPFVLTSESPLMLVGDPQLMTAEWAELATKKARSAVTRPAIAKILFATSSSRMAMVIPENTQSDLGQFAVRYARIVPSLNVQSIPLVIGRRVPFP